jgi:hypothetical protein
MLNSETDYCLIIKKLKNKMEILIRTSFHFTPYRYIIE